MKNIIFFAAFALFFLACNRSESTNYPRVPSNNNVGARNNTSFNKTNETLYGWDTETPRETNFSYHASVKMGGTTAAQVLIVPLQKKESDTSGIDKLVPMYSRYVADVEKVLARDGKAAGDSHDFGDLGVADHIKTFLVGGVSAGEGLLRILAQGAEAAILPPLPSGDLTEAAELNGVKFKVVPERTVQLELFSASQSDVTGMLSSFKQGVVSFNIVPSVFPSGWDRDGDGILDLSPYDLEDPAKEPPELTNLEGAIGGKNPNRQRLVVLDNVQMNFQILDFRELKNDAGGFGGYLYIVNIPWEYRTAYGVEFVKIGKGEWPYNIYVEPLDGDGPGRRIDDLDIDVFSSLYDKDGDGRVEEDEIVFHVEYRTNIESNFAPYRLVVENVSYASGVTSGFNSALGTSDGWAYVARRVPQLNPTRTAAHEVGHLLGLPHCSIDGGCYGRGKNLMDQDSELENKGAPSDFLSYGQWNRLHP